MPDAARAPSLTATVLALGTAQIISWGTLFYTIAVLGTAMREATGVGEFALYGSYSVGLIVSGLVAPAIGRNIDARGGRAVLSIGSIVAALACVALATVQGPISLLAAWLVAGVAMACTLYDPAFAALHRIAGTSYRRSVTLLTLLGGFASTAFWPLSQWLLDAYGMRTAFMVYAALHLCICLPLHLGFLRKDEVRAVLPRDTTPPVQRPGRAYMWLAGALAFASFAASALSAHMIGLLTSAGLTAREAVLIGALIGPAQVAGRLMEFAVARRVSPITTGAIAFATLAMSLGLFAMLDGRFALAVLFVVLYGWSNGVMTIVRGTVPAELFGSLNYGALLGRLAQPQFIARAIAPAALAVLLIADPSRRVALAGLAAGGLLAFVAYRRAVAK